MKKHIIKTALVTFLAVLCMGLIFSSLVSIFSPVTLAKYFDKLDNYSFSVRLYEKQYNKTNDYNDLSVVCTKIDEVKDAQKASEYLELFCEDNGFKNYCESNPSGTEMLTTAEYFYAKYTSAVLSAYGKEKAKTVADDYIGLFGNTKNNPYKILDLD